MPRSLRELHLSLWVWAPDCHPDLVAQYHYLHLASDGAGLPLGLSFLAVLSSPSLRRPSHLMAPHVICPDPQATAPAQFLSDAGTSFTSSSLIASMNGIPSRFSQETWLAGVFSSLA